MGHHPNSSQQIEKILELFELLVQGKYPLDQWYTTLKESCHKLTPKDIEFLKQEISHMLNQLANQGNEHKYYHNYNKLIRALRRMYW